MNSLSFALFLAAVCFCSAEVVETKSGKEKQLFRPLFIPLPFLPLPNPAPVVVTVAPVVPTATGGGTTTTTSNLPACPGSCCKRYCINALFCTAAVGPSTTPTCNVATNLPKRCINTLTTGCGATLCQPAANCNTECGVVLNISPVAFCP